MKKGFTLIEIMVTLAIVAVLGATTIPSMIGYVNDVKAKECEIVRNEMVEMYEVIRRDEVLPVSVDDFIKFVKANWREGTLCPSGAKYRYPVVGREPDTKILNVVIICDKHGSNNRNGLYVTAKILQDKYSEILKLEMPGLSPAEKQAEKKRLIKEEIEKISGKEFKFPHDNELVNNETFRQILMDGTDGKWETLDKSINEKISGKDLYVQAYVQPSGDVIIYANSTNALKSWDATAIYNPEDGYWYKPKAGSTPAYKNLDILKNDVHNWKTIKADLEKNWEKIPT